MAYRYLKYLSLVFLLVFGLACGSALPPPSAASPLVGKDMPNFKRRTLSGSSIDTKAARGHVVVVKFFAKYCEPCKKTLPAAEEYHRANPGVAFIGIALDERRSEAREVVDMYQLSFPVVHDAANVLSGRFRVDQLPVTFVIDKQGLVRWVGGPAQGAHDFARAVAAYSN